MTDLLWTKKKIDQMMMLKAQGVSSSKVADLMGTTRNAIIGKWTRERQKRGMLIPKVKKGGQPEKIKVGPKRRRRVKSKKKISTDRETASYSQLPKNISGNKKRQLVAEMDELHNKVLELNDRECHFPIGGIHDANFTYCFNPKKLGESYCKEHNEISYTKPGTGRRKEPIYTGPKVLVVR